jgi:hypothetical protein
LKQRWIQNFSQVPNKNGKLLSAKQEYSRKVLAAFPGIGVHNEHPVLVRVLRLAMQCFANLDLASFTWALSRAQRAPNCVRHNVVDRVSSLWAMEAAGEIASFSLEELRRHADYWCRGPRAFSCFFQ